MNTTAAKFLSYIFHPLLIPTYLLAGLFFVTPASVGADLFPRSSLGIILLVIWIYTFLMPVMGVYGLKRLNLVRDITLKSLEERQLPYILTTVAYLLSTYFFGWRFSQVSELAPILRVVLGSITVTITLVAMISTGWQISAHAAGVGGASGLFLAAITKWDDPVLISLLLLWILISGWVVAARLQLNAHTMSEVAAGYALGAIICAAGAILFL